MKVCFVLPQLVRKPIGGFKIVYEYASRLSRLGYDVSILFLNETAMKRFRIPPFLRKEAVEVFTRIEPKWFQLDSRVKKVSSLNTRAVEALKSSDAVVATGVDTVESVLRLFPKSRRFYFIQDYETWVYPEEKINQTFGAGLHNIVVARWLKEIVDLYDSGDTVLIPNPIDTKIYREITPAAERKAHTLGVLYHPGKHKGFKYAWEAIRILKQRYPDLTVYMFGTSKPEISEDYVHFTMNATREQTVDIYNKVQVFLCASVEEGYGLTGLEAMACGAALASTRYRGVLEYGEDGYNCLLSPVMDPKALADNASSFFDDEEKRLRITANGKRSVRKLDWEVAVSRFSATLKGQEKKNPN